MNKVFGEAGTHIPGRSLTGPLLSKALGVSHRSGRQPNLGAAGPGVTVARYPSQLTP